MNTVFKVSIFFKNDWLGVLRVTRICDIPDSDVKSLKASVDVNRDEQVHFLFFYYFSTSETL